MAAVAVLTRAACLLVIGLTAAGCRWGAPQWGPFRGQLVDIETGAPIRGAHVMVRWERDHPNPVHWTQSFYDAQESITDAEGRFEISRRRRIFTVFVTAPRFAAFAPGYMVVEEKVTPSGGRPYVDPTVVRLRPFRSRDEQCQHEPYGVGSLFPKEEVPMFAEAVDDYVQRLGCSR